MQFTFTLDKINPYISNNKMGNLKKFLKWDELDISQEQYDSLKRELSKENFSVLTNYDNALQHYIKNKFTPHKEERKGLLKTMFDTELKNFTYPDYIQEETSVFAQDFFNEICMEIQNDSRLAEKKEKLKKLQLINAK